MWWANLVASLNDTRFLLVIVLLFVLANQNLPHVLSFLLQRKKGLEGSPPAEVSSHTCLKEKDFVNISEQMRELEVDVEGVRSKVLQEAAVNQARHEEYLGRFSRIDERLDGIMDHLLQLKTRGTHG